MNSRRLSLFALALALVVGAGCVSCKNDDEGGGPVTTKPAGFKAAEGGEANGPKAGGEQGASQADAP